MHYTNMLNYQIHININYAKWLENLTKQIKKIVFHWSESILLSKKIDPSFQNRDDANYEVSHREAQQMINLAVDEMGEN